MTTFDVEGYRKAATAAGIPKSEIENEIKFQTSPVEKTDSFKKNDSGFQVGSPAKTDPFEKDEGGFKLGSLEQVQERLGNDWWHLPAGLAAIGVGIYGASKLMGGDPDDPNRPPNNPPNNTPRIDPTFDAGIQQPLGPVKPSLPQQTNLTPEDIQARAASLQQTPPAPVAPPVAPEVPVATPFSAAPAGAAAPTPSAQPGSSATSVVVDTVKELMDEAPAAVQPPAAAPQPVAPPKELLTGTGKPAFAGQGPEAALNKKGEPKFKTEYASVDAVPRGYAFVPGAQYIDTPRQNIGQAEYTKAYINSPFPLTNDLAIEQSKEINKMLGRATRAEMIAAGLPPAEITPGITKKTSAGTKPVKVAGALGALIAIPDLAKAETSGQRAMAGANLLEAILPPGFMMSGAGEGSTLSPEQLRYQQNAMLLGSPYAQSPQAVKLRQEQEYIRKVGAGRGIAPPSAYQR